MQAHNVAGGAGLRLHVREWGNNAKPPILLIHGWSQSHLCWRYQYESSLADDFRLVALDLRGHGMSEAPAAPEQYSDAQLWADDIAAVIAALELQRPVLVAWSYGGCVVCDYLAAYGATQIAGVNFVDALVTLNSSAFGTFIGPGFLDHVAGATDHDLPTNIAAIRNLVRGFTYASLPSEVFETAICWNMSVPPHIRAAVIARDEVDSEEILAALAMPVLVSHGRRDTVVLPAMAQHLLSKCSTATASWYAETAHCPFLEYPERFNKELSEFTLSAQAA